MVPVIHYLFYCYLRLKTMYIGILLVLSIASTIGTSSAACAKPRYRPFKAVLFIALGLYGLNSNLLFFFHSIVFRLGVAPATHACLLHGLPRMFEMGFLYLCIMAVTYIAGGVAYAIRIPERFFPGKENELMMSTFFFLIGRFDIVGQSHQILHVAVIAAVYLHFYGLCSLFHNVIQTEQCILPIKLKLGITDLSISS
jgi:adiponectin receptor